MLAHLNDDEQLAIKTFAAWYRETDHQQPWTRDAVLKYFDWSESRFHVVMHRLESLALVTDQSASGIEFLTFAIEPAICGAAEELQAAERKTGAAPLLDFADSILHTARRHPVLTWLVVLALAVAVLVTIINGGFELARNIRSLLSPAPLVP
jgi:hypothetical protein